MMFKKGANLFAFELVKEAGEDVIYVNYLGANFVPSIAESAETLSRTIDILLESPSASRIVFVQQRNYSYNNSQTIMLSEIAQFFSYLVKQEKVLSPEKLAFSCDKCLAKRYEAVSYFLALFKQDPFAGYHEIKKIILNEKNEVYPEETCKNCKGIYGRMLEKIKEGIENLQLFKQAIPRFSEYRIGERKFYSDFFRPDIIPNFTFTRLVSKFPENAEIIDEYEIGEGFDKSLVTIFKSLDEARYTYHLTPPEYTLSENYHLLLNLARNVLIEHRPKAEEFMDMDRTRQVFFNIAKDLISELAESKKITLNYEDLNTLSTILVRHTIGFGLIEVLLQDKKLQDIVLNSPISSVNVFVRHSQYDECITNVIPSVEDADSWAAKFRMLSGRPLDEANPVLDTELNIGRIKSRVAVVQQPLSPKGLAYALRRHREDPWTLPLFIKNKMINSLSAGVLSFLIDGARTMLIAGTRSSGKTSMLGALMLEIMPKFRIITVEDSVTGDSKIVFKQNGKFRKTTIGELINEQIKKHGFVDVDSREKSLNPDNLEIFSFSKKGRIVISKPSKFIRHKTDKKIYEIKTTSGKKIKVTGDHSLFTLDEKNIIKPIKAKEIKENGFIAIPLKLPFDNSLDEIDLLDNLYKISKKTFILGDGVEKYISKNRKELFSLAYSLGFKKSTIQNWTIKKILPSEIFLKIKDKIENKNLMIKSLRNSKVLPTKIILDEKMLNFLGLWLADGCYDKKSVIISVMEEENKEIVREIAKRFNIPVKLHSDKFSSLLNSIVFKEIMREVFEFEGNSYTKKIPSWMFNLSDKQMGFLLTGFFSGDGCASDKEIVFSTCSEELLNDITTQLLRFGIIARCSGIKQDDKTFNCRIGSTKMIKKFKDNIGFLVNSKQEKLVALTSRISTHDTSDIIPLSFETKKELSKILGEKFNQNDYIKRQNNLGREHLDKLLKNAYLEENVFIDSLKRIVHADIFWDRVKEIKEVKSDEFVYDISIPENENFICENIVAHNTLELPADSLRKIGYDILRMKVRPALLQSTTEIAADEGIRTSLRLGDSCLIIGEVRSVEARALYEAMRIGALANVVAGTIHGASPYGVFDRVVNDLNVPATSFKATDAILVCNPVKSSSGLQSWRRAVSLSEVRKHWSKDPLEERGFVDLLKYNVEKDELEATQDLINGDSEIIKDIAGNVKGWAGNWDAVYDNILLRGKIKQEIVDSSDKMGIPQLLEAGFNSLSNSVFYEISDKIRKEVGIPDSKRVFPLWQDWMREEARKIKEGKVV